MGYPILDRAAARLDPTVLDHWAETLEILYKAELANINLRFSPQDDTGRENALAEWERAATADREWADGYRRGLADSAEGDSSQRQGPGVMAHDRYDGWSPSVERRTGYEAGLADGSTPRRT